MKDLQDLQDFDETQCKICKRRINCRMEGASTPRLRAARAQGAREGITAATEGSLSGIGITTATEGSLSGGASLQPSI